MKNNKIVTKNFARSAEIIVFSPLEKYFFALFFEFTFDNLVAIPLD